MMSDVAVRPDRASVEAEARPSSRLSLRDPRILPFAVYMAFIPVSTGLQWTSEQGIFSASGLHQAEIWLYPLKTIVVAAMLAVFWLRYDELKDGCLSNASHLLQASTVGILVYAAWVRMEWSWATQGAASAGYDPSDAGAFVPLLIAVRLFGAAIVVPIMEELFWRSFLIRYIDATDYLSIRLGTFSVKAGLITVLLFGLEHELWLAGMMAGVAYNLLLYRTKRLWPCILAHGVTNLALGIHVLVTGEWKWW